MAFPRAARLFLLSLLSPLALAALLAACSASQEPKPHDADSSAGCDAAKVDYLIGQNVSGYIERQAMQESGASDVRVLRPGDAATMDFNPARLNIHTDPGKVIIKLACG
ncbi:I78 family peptidase inhibitor [Herbaspirillum sp. SJZ099]|uniref:I78 family peptidase inhibitor n=1 Tax=Herbaspirillum sp. SJZ099 TaxID=2572916 RepID=UPI0011A4774B|nr:I78 family peptidase inhibitor [Herbaspirillum sp. SJZ099]TWC64090.1 peptidase inhibitor I78 family protein [Herbaspirillum sp. SJZ099]